MFFLKCGHADWYYQVKHNLSINNVKIEMYTLKTLINTQITKKILKYICKRNN